MSSAKATTLRTQPAGKGQKRPHLKDLTVAPEYRIRSSSRITGALFLSGIAALLYQVLWAKQLTLVVGIQIYSITVAVSAFFAGLAAGSAMFGRVADRVVDPARLYAFLEILIAVFGVTATLLLAHTVAPFAFLEAHIGVFAWTLPFLLVGVPAFVMGGTLPIAVRAITGIKEQAASASGVLYAANTAGGIVGALLSSFAFIPWFGIRGTAFAAALFNLVSAAIVISAKRPNSNTAPLDPPSIRRFRAESRLALILYAAAGGIALGYEVVWSQAIAQFLSTRIFAFSIVLATYLAGLAVGSFLYARFAGRLRESWGVFGLLIAGAGLVAIMEIALLSQWQLRIQVSAGNLAYLATGRQSYRMYASFCVAAAGIVLLPTILLGAAFPLALRLTVGARRIGRGVGTVVALNTLGGIIGTLLTGLLLVPVLGLVRTLGMLAVAAAVVGSIAVLLGSDVGQRMKVFVVIVGLSAALTGILTPPDRLANLLLLTRGGGALVFYQESRGATVAVAQQHSKDNAFRRLFIQGVSNSGDAMPSLRYMRLQALLPLIIHRGEPKSALVIGFGTGITAGAVLHYPQLERSVCAELLPAVVYAGTLFPENYKAGVDPRLKIRFRDGRQELLRSSERYDVITLEPPPPSAQAVVNLYSTEFYRLASSRLETNGLLAQWLPIATQNDEDTRSLVRSFIDVFPYATLWSSEMHEMLLIGSQSPIELDMKQISKRFNLNGVNTSLTAVGIGSPAALLATWVTGRDGLEHYARDARPITDDQPGIEYAAWVRSKEIIRVLPNLLALRTEPPLRETDNVRGSEIGRERETLMSFYEAGIAAYEGDQQAWGLAMQKVYSRDPNNAYYRWVIGRD